MKIANQRMEEDGEANRGSAADLEPPKMVSFITSQNPNADTGDVSERNHDQGMGQDPSVPENCQSVDQNQYAANEEGNCSLLRLSFPRKLWAIIQDEAFKSVTWNDNGDTVVIETDLFQRQILQKNGTEKIFETDSLKTFIHQLYLHGFRKVGPEDSVAPCVEKKKMMMYHNVNFQRDKPGFLDYIWKKEDLRNSAHKVICVPIPLRNSSQQEPSSKRKKVAPTRRSPRFHKKVEKEDNGKCQRKPPKDQGPSGNQPSMFASVWAMKTIGCSAEHQPPQESCSPSGEGTTGRAMPAPPAAPGAEGTGGVSSSSLGCPNLGSVMSLYKDSCSVLLAGLPAMSPNESPDREQQEADYKRVICQYVKNSPHS